MQTFLSVSVGILFANIEELGRTLSRQFKARLSKVTRAGHTLTSSYKGVTNYYRLARWIFDAHLMIR